MTTQVERNKAEDIHIWQNVIPEEAIQHEFLMDGILALSALHYASINPNARREYTEMAMRFQNCALQEYQRALRSITSDNHSAIFAYSVILNILALAFPNVCPELAPESHADSVATLIELLQGIRLITGSQTTALPLRSSKFAALFRSLSMRDSVPAPGDDVADALTKLRDSVNGIGGSSDSEKQQAYLSGILELETAFGYFDESNNVGHIFAWPATVSDELLRLFKQGDVMAQLIFLHYGVLLLQTRDRWWGKDTGACLIESLACSIYAQAPEWGHHTEWAKKMRKDAL